MALLRVEQWRGARRAPPVASTAGQVPGPGITVGGDLPSGVTRILFRSCSADALAGAAPRHPGVKRQSQAGAWRSQGRTQARGMWRSRHADPILGLRVCTGIVR